MRLTSLFALAALLGTWNAHAQVFTYPSGYSIWNPVDSRIKYVGFAALVDASDAEIARAPVPNIFLTTLTVNFPAQATSVTVAKLRLGWTQTGTTAGVVDLDGTYSPTYKLTPPFAVPAGSATKVEYNTITGGIVATVTAPVAPPPLPTPDITPPVVSLTAPLAGATFVGTNALTAIASDNVGVVGVQFGIDGANYGAEIAAPPYTTVWNSTAVLDGAHTINAVARDAAGNRASSAVVTVKVSNAPAPPTPPGVSPDGSSIPPLTKLVDAVGAVWTQVGTHPLRNGLEVDGSGSILVTIKAGVIYFKQGDVVNFRWLRWAGNGWAVSAAP